MPFAEVNGVRIHYTLHGSGSPLILIPGWGGSGDSWRRDMIEALGGKHSVVVFDPRGTGRSDKPDEPYSLAGMASDVAGLLKAIGMAPAHVMGFSMGGSVAQVLALDHPEVVRSLVLACASSPGGPRVPMSRENAERFSSISNPPPGSPPDYGAIVIVDLLYPPEYVAEHREALVKEEFYSEYPTPKYVLKRMSAATGNTDTYSRLPSLKVPTLVLAGGADAMVSPENSKAIAGRIPGARLRVFPGAGHGLLKQKTREAVEEILGFLEQ